MYRDNQPACPQTTQNPTVMDLDPLHKWLGIPPSEQPPHHYRLLGIDLFESDSDVIDSGAQRQMSHVRTYALGPNKEASQTLLNQLAAARVALLNPATKKQYDQILRQEIVVQTDTGQQKTNIPVDSVDGDFSGSSPHSERAAAEPVPAINSLSCPNCNVLLTVAKNYFGQEVQCSHCHATLLTSPDGRELQVQTQTPKVTPTTPHFAFEKSSPIANRNSPRIRTKRTKKRRSKPTVLLTITSISVLICVSVFLYMLFRGHLTENGLASGISKDRRQQNSSSRNTTNNRRSAQKNASKKDLRKTPSLSHSQAATQQNSNRNGFRAASGQQISDAGQLDGSNPKLTTLNAESVLMDSGGDGGTAASLPNPIEMRFIVIPAGEFVMGSGPGAQRVTLTRAFEMGIHEVTQAQFESVMNENPSQVKSPELPVEQVSWEQASIFCQRLSASQEAKENGYQYRLPYEAEWEYACRAGRSSKTQFRNEVTDLNDIAWFSSNSNNTPHPVGTKQANAWGLHDMLGNVSEWCMDWKGTDKPTTAATDPHGPAIGTARINRGGSWLTGADRFQKAVQSWGAPNLKATDIGFRVVRTLNKNQTGAVSPAQEYSNSSSNKGASSPPRNVGEPNPTIARELSSLRELIRNAKWQEMKKQADKLLTMRMDDRQQAETEALREIADLATYYRTGIEKSVDSLDSGNDFEVRKNLRVLVVEKGRDFLTILYDRKRKTYTFDEMPFSLAHKLATFEIPESRRQVAAKAVYQFISPLSDKQSRDEALTWLSEIEDDFGEENPKRIAASLRRIFSSDAGTPEN